MDTREENRGKENWEAARQNIMERMENNDYSANRSEHISHPDGDVEIIVHIEGNQYISERLDMRLTALFANMKSEAERGVYGLPSDSEGDETDE